MELQPSQNHAVLFNLPLPCRDDELPKPQRGAVLWDHEHVRLPSSNYSQFAEIDANGTKTLKQRWNLIEESLLRKINNSRQLENAIKKYNTRYQEIWDFVTLHELFETQLSPEYSHQFFEHYLPKLISLALQLPHMVQCPIPLLKQGKNKSISMSQQQVACLLANAFLCTFPRRNTDRSNSEYSNYPDINFNKLFSRRGQNVIEKLKCILNYFVRVLDKMPTNVVTFQRRSTDAEIDWESSSVKLSRTKFLVKSKGKIEEGKGMLQVDFANRFVGGGVLGHGCVQEEIRFVINPEMIVARLFTESLKDQEALIIIGCEQFSSYSGYASCFRWAGDFVDTTPLDIYRRRKCRVVAIDALLYKSCYDQFKKGNFTRDLKKAYVGFISESPFDRSPVASGLWGCGAFNGHAIRSALIQLMACSMAQRNIVLYTFGDSFVRSEIIDVYTFLQEKDLSVGQLYKLLNKYRYEGHPNDPNQLIPFIKKQYELKVKSNSNHNLKIVHESSSEKNKEWNQSVTVNSSLKPQMHQSSLLNFVTRASPNNDSRSYNEQPVSSTASRDDHRFNEVCSVFDQFKKEVKKPSLLQCLDMAETKQTQRDRSQEK